jgi:hypothetical protein
MPYFGADNINFASPEAKPFIAARNLACYISCDIRAVIISKKRR